MLVPSLGDLKAIFKTKHVLRVTAYKELDPEIRKVIDTVVMSKPGLPTLTIVEAKPEKVTP